MAISCFKRPQKRSSSISSMSTTNTFSITSCFFSLFSPFRRRNATIFHYASAPVESMIEENERLQLESKIDDLPDPLLMDILQRLPLNSVFRSKCVSKRWLALISDPVFSQNYNSHRQYLTPSFALVCTSSVPRPDYPCDMVLYCSHSGPESVSFPLNFFESKLFKKQAETYPLELVGIDNDLLLFSGLYEPHRDSYCVCNPLTFEWINLPPPPRHRTRYPVVGFMVEEDGTFWVVQILSSKPDHSRFIVFEVFSSGTGKWSSRDVFCLHHLDLSRGKRTTVVYKGIMIWMVDGKLLAFDPKDDRGHCRVIDLPNNEMGSFGVSSGRLHYYAVKSYIPWEPIESPMLRVWVMIDFETGEWVLEHSISYGHFWSCDERLRHGLLVPKKQKKCFEWVSYHPTDSDVVFLRLDERLVTCNIPCACLEVVPRDIKRRNFYILEGDVDVLPLVFRSWPRVIAETFEKINELCL